MNPDRLQRGEIRCFEPTSDRAQSLQQPYKTARLLHLREKHRKNEKVYRIICRKFKKIQITKKRQIDDIGEKASRKYLKKNGYNIVAKNYNTKYGEIDIVAENKKYIVFVEVKTRKENSLYAPVLAVTKQKQNKLMKTAYVYLKEYPTNKNIRFR